MSFHVFFEFSQGFSGPMTVPKGTLKRIVDHVQWVESELGYETEQYRDNPKHWKTTKPKEGVSDETYCEVAEEHNMFVRYLYSDFSKWAETPPADGEIITQDDAKEFWHGLQTIIVPTSRWTKEYYIARMQALYETMRGRDSEGMSFDAKSLTIEQADAVITMFDQYLDSHDVRLAVPVGYDSLYSSDDYAWCDKCGAIHWDDVEYRIKHCRKRGGCSLRRDYKD
jgi:hypothetical protein